MSTWIWALIAFMLLMRGNHANLRRDEAEKKARDIQSRFLGEQHDTGQKRYDAAVARTIFGPQFQAQDSREERVNTKLRDRCVSLEQSLKDAQDEIRKLNQKGNSHVKAGF